MTKTKFHSKYFQNHIFILDCDSLPCDFHFIPPVEICVAQFFFQLTFITCWKSM